MSPMLLPLHLALQMQQACRYQPRLGEDVSLDNETDDQFVRPHGAAARTRREIIAIVGV
jgi:hypothetical protein